MRASPKTLKGLRAIRSNESTRGLSNPEGTKHHATLVGDTGQISNRLMDPTASYELVSKAEGS
jgi:hypothetical protein